MSHDEIKRLFNLVYNDFYLKYRYKGTKKTDAEWEEIAMAGEKIVEEFHGEALARSMVIDIIEQLELSEKNQPNF